MNLVINPQAPLPIYAQIIEQIRDLIFGGQLKPGDTLPSVRQLAESLEINSLTIQKAYKGLEASGLIAIKKGVGAFVREDVQTSLDSDKLKLIRDDLRPLVKKAKALNVKQSEFNSIVDELWES
ncbi:MAG: GntR family transcriptional regulator [Oligoflexus sp.]